MFRFGVVGAGLIGRRRALDSVTIQNTSVSWVSDPDRANGEKLARDLSDRQGSLCRWVDRPEQVLDLEPVDLAMIAVPHDRATEIASMFLNADVNVHLEKPMGRNLHEAQTLSRVAEASAGQLALGFNYRHYPAVLRARQLIDSGMIGRPLLARMVLGHGGRPGYEREWKLQRERAGGGALLDPGIHLIDLAQYFLGELRSESVQLQRLYWQTDVEDLATVVLTPLSGGTVVIQSSLLEWKSTFHIELQGSDGYLKINGRMGTYGEQSLAFGRRWAWLNGQSQAEQEELETFGTEDTSFRSQLESVVTALRSGERVPVGLTAGLSTMTIIHDLYDLAGTPEAVQGVAR